MEFRDTYDQSNDLSLLRFNHEILGRSIFSYAAGETYRHIFNMFQDEFLPPFIRQCLDNDMNYIPSPTSLIRSQYMKYRSQFYICHSDWFFSWGSGSFTEDNLQLKWKIPIFHDTKEKYFMRSVKDLKISAKQILELDYAMESMGPTSGKYYDLDEWIWLWREMLHYGLHFTEEKLKRMVLVIRYFGRLN